MKKIKKAVIAAGGFGTRMLPITSVIPKEMIPIVNKPVIQYIVEELIEAGIEEVGIVTSSKHSLTEQYFEGNKRLEAHLIEKNKLYLMDEVNLIHKKIKIHFSLQTNLFPYGNGTPLLVEKDFLDGEDNYLYVFCDDLVLSNPGASKQLIDFASIVNSPSIACEVVDDSEVSKYGIIEYIEEGSKKTKKLSKIIEKPSPEETSSRLASYGRYVLNKDIINILSKKGIGKNNELWLTDSIESYVASGGDVYTKVINGWYTTGDYANFLKTMIQFTVSNTEYGDKFKESVKEILE